MEVIPFPEAVVRGRRRYAAVALACLLLTAATTSAVFAWNRIAFDVPSPVARAALSTGGAMSEREERAAVVSLFSDVQESVAVLVRLAAKEGPTAEQARAALAQLRLQIGK